MQHGRGRRLQDAHCPQRDEGRVEGQHKVVVGADTALQGVGDGLEDDQLLEAVGLDGHVCDLAGDGSAGVDGDADVSGREGGGVVDAVADHHDGVALALGLLDESSLVLGQDFGEELVHTHLLCDGGGGSGGGGGNNCAFYRSEIKRLSSRLANGTKANAGRKGSAAGKNAAHSISPDLADGATAGDYRVIHSSDRLNNTYAKSLEQMQRKARQAGCTF